MIFYVIPNFSEAVSKSKAHRKWRTADRMSRSSHDARASAGKTSIDKMVTKSGHYKGKPNAARIHRTASNYYANMAAQDRKAGDKKGARARIRMARHSRQDAKYRGFKLP